MDAGRCTTDIYAAKVSGSTTNSNKPSSYGRYMLAGITVFLTIVFALFFGIFAGWAVLAGMLYAFGQRRGLQPKSQPKLAKAAVALSSQTSAS
jgi:hypothetical protein